MKRLSFLVALFFALSAAMLFAEAVKMDEWLPGSFAIWLDPSFETTCEYDNNGILITGIPEIDELNARYGVTFGEYMFPIRKMRPGRKTYLMDFRNLYEFKVSDLSTDIPALCEVYKSVQGVLECDPNFLIPKMKVTPNDPKFSSQWHLDKIQAIDAWDYTTGDSSVVVSCFESVDWGHKDIGPVLWQNLGEDANGNGATVVYSRSANGYIFDRGDVNGIDDDGNGYIDDFIGWDFIRDLCGYDRIHPEEACGFEDNAPMDVIGEVGHGTHVSATMTSATNNGYGCASISWQPRITCLRTEYTYMGDYGWHGAHETNATIRAFGYAIDNGVDVFCLSYGGYSYSGVVSSVLRRAWDSTGVNIIAAAGNENVAELSYPASYYMVMGVAATEQTDRKAAFSNYGDRIDIAAPGVGIWAAIPRHIGSV
jgi:hypothetical protein